MDLLVNSTKHLRKKLHQFSTLSQKILIEAEGVLLNSFCEVGITLIPKSDKDSARKENYGPISLIGVQIFKILANQI